MSAGVGCSLPVERDEAYRKEGDLLMNVIGLTGGSGAGKGYVSGILTERGIPVLDTDRVSRSVCMPESRCLNELVHAFGSQILLPDGTYNRPFMAELVMNDGNRRRMLNRITHRHILCECRLWLDRCRENGFLAAVIDAPLLFESGFDRECDAVIGVVASDATRIDRIVMRDGISAEAAQKRLAAQKNNAFYLEKCDEIIYNEEGSSRKELSERVDSVLDRLCISCRK